MSRLRNGAIASILALAACPLWAVPVYSIVDLGTLGGNYIEPRGMNDRGDIVGWGAVTGGQMPTAAAFVYRDGVMSALPTFGGSFGVANDINNRGQIVGYSYLNGDQDYRAFLYEDDVLADLGTLDGNPSAAYAISERGQIVGHAFAGGRDVSRAVLFENGSAIDLGTTPGTSYVAAINERGQIALTARASPYEEQHAFLYDKGVLRDLGTLGGQPDWSQARGVNNRGHVVGDSFADNTLRGFLYADGMMRDIGSLGGNAFDRTVATSINNAGRIVGFSDTVIDNTGVQHAFLVIDGVMYDLNDLIDPMLSSFVTLISAAAINEAGWIAAQGFDNRVNETRLYLLKRGARHAIAPR